MSAQRGGWLLISLFLAAPAWADGNSGLPVPRWVSIKASEANIRTGPGTRYPIQFIYRRAGMPVEVIEEFGLWRKIRDMDGATGWMHKTMLDGRRNVAVRSKEERILRAGPEAKARPILKLEPQVIARLIACEEAWCRVQVSGRKGWLEKKYLFGVYPEETFN